MTRSRRNIEKGLGHLASPGCAAWRGRAVPSHCSRLEHCFRPDQAPVLPTGLPVEHAVLHINPEAGGPPEQRGLLRLLPWLCLARHGFLRYQCDHVGPLHWRAAAVTPVRAASPLPLPGGVFDGKPVLVQDTVCSCLFWGTGVQQCFIVNSQISPECLQVSGYRRLSVLLWIQHYETSQWLFLSTY